MTLEIDGQFQEKQTWGLENNIRNLANFHQKKQKSQNWYFYCLKLKMYELKIYRTWSSKLTKEI